MIEPELNQAGREELALALVLWKEFKSNGKVDVAIYVQFNKMVLMLGVEKEAQELLRQLPPLKIVERYPVQGG